MNKIFLSVVVVATLFLIGCDHDDHHRGGGHGKHYEKKIHRMHKRIASRLDLNEKQKEALSQVANNLIEKKKSLQIRKTRKKQRELMYKSLTEKNIRTDELKAIQKERSDKKVEFRNFRIDQYSQFYQLLTDEQKDEVAEFGRDMWEEYQEHEDDK